MVFTFNPSTREVLEQVVRQPKFQALTQLPVLAPMEIALGLGAFALFGLGTGLYVNDQIPFLLMLCMNSAAIYASFTPLHDATHRSVSSNRRVNDWIGTLCCLLLIPGITTRIYRYLHLEHHRFAGNGEKDPDEPFVSAHPLLLPFVLAGLDVYWTLWYLRHWSTRPANERLEFVGCLTFYLGLHLAFLLSPYALEFFLCFMIPQRFGLFLVAWFFAHIQHPEGAEWEQAPFQTTVLVKTNKVGRWLMLGQTYHCLHHLAPSIPYYRYERAWRVGERLFLQQGVPTRTLWRSAQAPVPPVAAGRWLSARVAKVQDLANGVRGLELVPADAVPWPGFEAGAHIDVKLGQDKVRQYSLCNSPEEDQRYRIAVKHALQGEGGSAWIHAQVQEGDRLSISAPRNHFALDPSDDDHLLIGAGIGITPLLAMAHALHSGGRAFALHLFASQASDLAFHAELTALPFAENIQLHCGAVPHDARIAQAARLLERQPGGNPGLYLCGPPGFMQAVMQEARQAGWPESSLHSESFVATASVQAENRPFEVQIASTGEVLAVDEDSHLIDVLHQHGYAVACSCTQGICGSCITPVLEGVPEHRDAIMTDRQRSANDRMTVCVSRARSERLVLDL